MLLTGIVFPVSLYFSWCRNIFARFYFPVAPMHFCLLFLGAYIYGKFYTSWNPNPILIKDGNSFTEIREFLFGVAMMVFALQGMRNPFDIIVRR